MDTMISVTGKELYLCGSSTDEAEACLGCVPKMVLTPDEESILKTMRKVKDQAKPISERLKELELSLKSPTVGHDAKALKDEWEQLRAQLEGFRTQWKEWEHRLDEAIELKHIALGHREEHS